MGIYHLPTLNKVHHIMTLWYSSLSAQVCANSAQSAISRSHGAMRLGVLMVINRGGVPVPFSAKTVRGATVAEGVICANSVWRRMETL